MSRLRSRNPSGHGRTSLTREPTGFLVAGRDEMANATCTARANWLRLGRRLALVRR